MAKKPEPTGEVWYVSIYNERDAAVFTRKFQLFHQAVDYATTVKGDVSIYTEYNPQGCVPCFFMWMQDGHVVSMVNRKEIPPGFAMIKGTWSYQPKR